MKQNVTPAMNKIMIPSTACYSMDSLLPVILRSYGDRFAYVDDYDYFPTNIFGGYMFGKKTVASLFAGSYSPHQIIKPGKDTVDLQVDIWWMGGAAHTDAPDFNVGWAVQMGMIPGNQVGYALELQPTALQILGLMDTPPEHPMGNPQVSSVDADGHVSWKYDYATQGSGGIAWDYPFVRPYPLSQWAVGYAASVRYPNSIPGLPVGSRPYWPLSFYKTPIRMVIKKDNVLTTDPTFSFRDFRGGAGDDPLGISFQIFRLKGACDGVFQDGVFGYDTHESDFSDAAFGLMDGNSEQIAPIFLGMEMNIL